MKWADQGTDQELHLPWDGHLVQQKARRQQVQQVEECSHGLSFSELKAKEPQQQDSSLPQETKQQVDLKETQMAHCCSKSSEHCSEVMASP